MFPPFHFSQRLPTVSFSSSFFSSPSSLHIIHNSSFFFSFSLQKPPSPLSFSHFLTLSFSLNPLTFSFSLILSSSSPMASKAKKSSYVLSSNAFHLTRWSGAMRLVGSLPLIYYPENHIPIAEFVIFQFFSHFQVSL